MKPNFYSKMLRQAPGEPGAGAEPAPVPEPAPVDPGPDLSFIPADFHVDGKPDLGKFSASYQELVARDAQRAEAEAALKAAVPEGDYSFALPEDLKFDGLDLPEGYSVNVLAEDEAMKPLFADLSGWLKERNMPAAASTELMTMLAKYTATQAAQAIAAQKADMAKLGTPAQVAARTATVERAISSRLPAELAEAVLGMTTNARALQGLERLLGPSSTTPQPAAPGATTEGLTAYERLQRANSAGL